VTHATRSFALEPAADAWEHTFVTSQGSPYARFRRAIDSGNSTIALAAARELPHLNLADALALLLVLRGDRRYSKAAARWHARFVMEAPVTLSESQLALCALGALPDQHAAPAVAALERLFASIGRRDLAEALLRWR
jgi:hypothetical protein